MSKPQTKPTDNAKASGKGAVVPKPEVDADKQDQQPKPEVDAGQVVNAEGGQDAGDDVDGPAPLEADGEPEDELDDNRMYQCKLKAPHYIGGVLLKKGHTGAFKGSQISNNMDVLKPL